MINKKCEDHEFTEKDVEVRFLKQKVSKLRVLKMTIVNFHIQVVKNYLTFCGIGITNAQLFELSVMEYRRNQVRAYLALFLYMK